MLDFRLESFLAVCRHMNYTRAAEELNLTQPAVSQHIRWLEERYGTTLFRYTNRRLSLTKAGELLRSAAITIQHDDRHLMEQMQQVALSPHDLKFGVTPTIGMYLVPKPLSQYHAMFPDANITMQVDNTQALCQALDVGKLDFAIVEGYVHKSDYDSMLYQSQPYFAVCAAHYPFAKEPTKIAHLLGETLLVREQGSGNREIVRRSLSRSNIALTDFRSLMEISDMNVLKEMLKLGCGVAFLYEAAVQEDIKAGKIRKLHLEDVQEQYEMTFIWRRGSLFAQQYQQLYALLKPMGC